MTSKAPPLLPELGDVVFSLKTFVAAMLALLIALIFDLQNPYWAVGTVYIVSHPLSGASTSKALYRLLGTAIGGAMTVILLPNLVNAPVLLILAIGLWIGVCLAISLLDRTPRSYVFMLAGYTTALTGFPIVDSPDTAFTYATARVVEIAVGIICTALVSRLFFPRHAGPVLAKRIDNWMAQAGTLLKQTLEGRGQDPQLTALGRKLAAEAVDLRSFSTHVAYDTSSYRDLLGLSRTLQRRMVAILPIISGLADVLATLSRDTNGRMPPALAALIAEVSQWLDSGESLSEDKRAAFLASMASAGDEARTLAEWPELLVHNAVARLRDLIQIWSDCLDVKQDITSGTKHALRWRRYGMSLDERPMHKDYGMALYSGLSAMFATCVACAFWIFTGWSSGNASAMMAGVVFCLFAGLDDPLPMMRQFLYASIAAMGVAFVIEFAALPLIHSYIPLAAILGLALFPAGILVAKPRTMLYGLAFGVNLPNMLSLQDRLNLDFETFINSNVALCFGLVLACVTIAIIRSVGAEWSAVRLLRAGWADIAAVARNPRGADVTPLLHRMVDRFGLAAPRLAAIQAGSDAVEADMLKDLRNGLNIVDLHRNRQILHHESRKAIDEALGEISAHYRARCSNPASVPEKGLLFALDRALATVSDEHAPEAVEAARRALTGLRYNLFPDAKGFAANENRPATAPGAKDLKEHAA